MPKINAHKEMATSILMSILSISLLVQSFSYPTRSSQFPRLLTASMTFLSLFLVARAIKDLKNCGNKQNLPGVFEVIHKNKTTIGIFLLISLYIFLISIIGYFSSSILFLVFAMFVFGKHKIISMVFISSVFLSVIYFLFVYFLGLRLPSGLLF